MIFIAHKFKKCVQLLRLTLMFACISLVCFAVHAVEVGPLQAPQSPPIPKRDVERKLQRLAAIKADANLIQAYVKYYNQRYVRDHAVHPLQYDATTGRYAFAGSNMLFPGNNSVKLPEKVYGLTLFVAFSDDPETPSVSVSQLVDLVNKENYFANGNTGSVYDYFYAQSNGKLKLKQKCPTGYIRLPRPRSYYERLPLANGQPQNFVREVLSALAVQYPDFVASKDYKALTVSPEGNVRSLSIFYTGGRPQKSNGGENSRSALWPHRSRSLNFDLAGKHFFEYQITAISGVTIGDFCHESAHMICNYSDYYDQTFTSHGLASHCLMADGNRNNHRKSPGDLGAYLKYMMGWVNPIEIKPTTRKLTLTTLSPNAVYIYRKPNSVTEYFLIENRYVPEERTDPFRYHLPAHGGIAIWHIDEAMMGNNSCQMTTPFHYECSLEQAQGIFELERLHGMNRDSHLREHYFSTATQTIFDGESCPNSAWWDGHASGLALSEMTGPAPSVTVAVAFQKTFPALPVFSLPSGTITAEQSVTITCTDPDAVIYYSMDGRDPTLKSARYTGPIKIPATQATLLKAMVYKKGFAPNFASVRYAPPKKANWLQNRN